MRSSRVVVLATLGGLSLTLTSCGSTTDCTVRRDCPSDLAAGTIGASGAAGMSGTAGRSGGASGPSGRAGTSGEAGTSGDAGAAGAPSTCDGSLTPDVESCVISDDYGVFVAPTGDDTTGDGTEAAPYATLTTALAKLDAIKRIYVCAAEYKEPSTLEIPGGVSIYGGFGCEGGVWTYDSVNNKASFKPMSPIGAELNGAKGVTLADLSITAANATSPGGSSFGMTIVSSNVVLTRVEIKAGSGGNGIQGANGDAGTPGLTPTGAQNGLPGSCSPLSNTLLGGKAATPSCTSEGGKGGDGVVSSSFDPQQNGATGFPKYTTNFGAGGTMPGTAGAVGGTGAAGADGDLGAGAAANGEFSATGFAVASGSSGTLGKPGQGGGGGGSSTVTSACVGSSGGAGGMGGCGGQFGSGGMGGGASVALLSWGSSVTMDSCSLVAAVGGSGGAGGLGGVGGGGKAGGAGGNPDPAIPGIKSGGKGGDGGDGGDGGSGAGGTGGPSIALVYGGTEPVRKNTKLAFPAKGGAAGQGGRLSADDKKWAPDGSVGPAQDIYAEPQ